MKTATRMARLSSFTFAFCLLPLAFYFLPSVTPGQSSVRKGEAGRPSEL